MAQVEATDRRDRVRIVGLGEEMPLAGTVEEEEIAKAVELARTKNGAVE